jgi:flagellar hook-associated protein FlgK
MFSAENSLVSQLFELDNEIKNADSQDFQKIYSLLNKRDHLIHELENVSSSRDD